MTHVSNPEIGDPADAPPDEPQPGQTMTRRQNPGVLVTADNAADLLRRAIDRGVAVEQLSALVDLSERVEARQARREYFAALKAFQEDYAKNPVIKQRTADIASNRGADFAYKYANADDVAKHIGPMLMEHGLNYKWDSKVEGGMLTLTTIVMHEGGHSEASNFSVPTENRAGMSPQQKVGSASSYAQARGLANALGITITDEPSDLVDPTPIDDDMIMEIQEIVESKGIDVRRILKFAGVEKVADIRRGDYLKVLAALDRVAPPKGKAQ